MFNNIDLTTFSDAQNKKEDTYRRKNFGSGTTILRGLWRQYYFGYFVRHCLKFLSMVRYHDGLEKMEDERDQQNNLFTNKPYIGKIKKRSLYLKFSHLPQYSSSTLFDSSG